MAQGGAKEAEVAMVQVGAEVEVQVGAEVEVEVEVEVEEGRIDGSGWVGDDVDAPYL